MDDTARAATPLHLWIIGGLATVWNGFGSLDYLMTQMRVDGWINSMMKGVDPRAVYAYIESFPVWAQAGWALGVWGGLAGSILLLMRSRWAFVAFGVSLLGAILGLGYQIMNPGGPAEMHEGFGALAPYIIILVALGLFLYARAMRGRGVLR